MSYCLYKSSKSDSWELNKFSDVLRSTTWSSDITWKQELKMNLLKITKIAKKNSVNIWHTLFCQNLDFHQLCCKIQCHKC